MTTTDEISIRAPAHSRGASTWDLFVRKITPYLFISPFYVVFLIFSLLPIAFSIFLSLADWNGMSGIKFTGLDNFITLFQDPKFWNSLRVSLIITVVCTLVGTAGSLLLAVLLEKVEDRLARARNTKDHPIRWIDYYF